jgi:hypothetical protein
MTTEQKITAIEAVRETLENMGILVSVLGTKALIDTGTLFVKNCECGKPAVIELLEDGLWRISCIDCRFMVNNIAKDKATESWNSWVNGR